jgi:ribosomal protein L32
MNLSNDRISKYISSTHHKPHYLWECLSPNCRFQSNCQAIFLEHKASKKCSMYNGDWFLKMKKKGFKNYYFIVWRYYWSQIMIDIRK